MNGSMGRILSRFPIFGNLWSRVGARVQAKREAEKLREWEAKGRPAPPPHILKQRVLREHSQKYGLRTLVETGTYCGDMVEAMRGAFDRIYSIELSEELWRKAKTRFDGQRHIEILHGDSGKVLKDLMKRIDGPSLFWLDGHYSAGVTAKGDKDTPIYEEFEHILGAPDRRHVVIVDDARLFGTDAAYPSLDELRAFITSRRTNVEIVVKDDSIRVLPHG